MEIVEVNKCFCSELNSFQNSITRESYMVFSFINLLEDSNSYSNKIAWHALAELCKKKDLNQELKEILESNI